MGMSESTAKRPRFSTEGIDTSVLPSEDLRAAADQLEVARANNRRRAERFGKAYVEPDVFTAVDNKGDALRLLRQRDAGLVTGFDVTADDQEVKRKARAQRFNLASPFDFAAAPIVSAGLPAEAAKILEARRERAKRFNTVDELDVLQAKAAVEALGSGPETAGILDAADPPAINPVALHVRGYGYLPAGTRDLMAYFGELRPAYIEWLNGVSVNVFFGDEGSAKRALHSLSQPIPRVADIPPVHEAWRVCLKPLIKLKTDKYAPVGTQTTLYMRCATANDTKVLAARTAGPNTFGTYSKGGTYSIRKSSGGSKGGDEGMEEVAEGVAPDPTAVVKPKGSAYGVLTGAATVSSVVLAHLQDASRGIAASVEEMTSHHAGVKRRRDNTRAAPESSSEEEGTGSGGEVAPVRRVRAVKVRAAPTRKPARVSGMRDILGGGPMAVIEPEGAGGSNHDGDGGAGEADVQLGLPLEEPPAAAPRAPLEDAAALDALAAQDGT